MILIEEAERILQRIRFEPETEEVPLLSALGRVLAQDVVSTINMPPFDKSAMDGYALKEKDDSTRFEIIEVIAAGSVPVHTIQKGQCAKIMTGAMVPPGADRVVKVEVTEESDAFMTILDKDYRPNICYKGEDVKPGHRVLTKNRLIRPQEVGVCAAMGLDKVLVYKKTKVGIITTGSEIREPGLPLQEGQIYNSNGYSISAQVLNTGAEVIYEGLVDDDVESIRQKIEKLLEDTQMVLISGGVSMGDYDFVPRILKEMGVELHFHKVAIQPGKPTIFGTRNGKLVFGMPGNPVSTFTIFEVFVKPMLLKTMGLNYIPSEIPGTLVKDFKRKRSVRTAYVPVIYNNDGEVRPVEYHGSAHLNALCEANGLIKIPRGTTEILKGTTLHVRQI